jgi:hypothetical protein
MQLEGVGWQRGYTDICYYPNNICRKGCAISYYTLTITFVAKFSREQVYFAHSGRCAKPSLATPAPC